MFAFKRKAETPIYQAAVQQKYVHDLSGKVKASEGELDFIPHSLV